MVNDFELVVAGVARLLEDFPQVEVAEQIVVDEPIDQPVDVALYDTYGHAGAAAAVRALVARPKCRRWRSSLSICTPT